MSQRILIDSASDGIKLSPHKSSQSEDYSFKPNIATLLCYILLLLNPLGAIAAIIFLNTNPYKKYLFIRFHSFQALLLSAIAFGTFVFSYYWLVASTGYGDINALVTIVGFIIKYFIIGVSIFMSYKAYKMEMYKLPIIGDWAMNFADKNKELIENNYPEPSEVQKDSIIKVVVDKESKADLPTSFQPIPKPLQEDLSIFQRNSEIPFNKSDQNINIFTETEIGQSTELERKPYISKREKIILSSVLVPVLLLILGIAFYSTRNTIPVDISAEPDFNNETISTSGYSENTSDSDSVSDENSNMGIMADDSDVNTMAETNYSTDNSESNFRKTGRLTMDLNIRNEANKDSYSLGIHFKHAKVEVLDETSYELNGEVSTWFNIKVTEYGCSVDSSLGCGKNSPNDADQGWVNAKYVLLD